MDQKIVEYVSKRPFLFDKRHKEYINSTKKAEAWEDLARNIGTDVENVKRRWKTLRDQYAREMRIEMGNASRTERPAKRKFAYWDQMHFLRSTYKSRKSKNHLDPAFEDFQGLDEFIDFPGGSSSPKDTTEDSSDDNESMLSGTQKCEENSQKSVENNTEVDIMKILNAIKPPTPIDDHITYFVKNIEGYVRSTNLTTTELLEFQYSIFESLKAILAKRIV